LYGNFVKEIKLNKPYLNGLLASAAAAALLLNPVNASAAVDMFLKIDGVTGESVDAKHKGEIDVLAWSWGETKTTVPAHIGAGAGNSTSKPLACITDLAFTKYIDESTPHLITSGVKNDFFASAKLTVRKAGDVPLEYFTITMTNVSIVSYQTGSTGTQDRLTENIVLHFNAAHGEYIPQDPRSGAIGTPMPWDVAENNGRGGPSCP
jgi:type VI secretion system secreted protein Hcp